MAFVHEATLTLGSTGTRLNVWDEYELELDLLKAGSPWTATLYRSADADSAWKATLEQSKCGDSVIFALDGAPQLNGRIELVKPMGSRRAEQIILSGRDLAGVPMSWDASPRISLRNQTLESALQQLFEPLGLRVLVSADATIAREVQSNLLPNRRSTARHPRRQKVDHFHPKVGEKVWPLAERLCRRYGLLLWIAPDAGGQLAVIVGTPAYDTPAVYHFYQREEGVAATVDSNMIERDYTVQIRDTPTEVFVYAAGASGDNDGARICAHVDNDRFDPRFVLRPLPVQPRHVRAERARTPDHARQEGERLVSDAMANHRVYTAKVQGHGQLVEGKMRLYAINMMAHVLDSSFGIDEDFLISRVQFRRSRTDGTTTTVTMHPPHALNLTPEPEAGAA